ncbi:MAG: hypothetical protein ACJZ5D_01395 [Candidatus Thalassarchaeaceae archaeon]
MYNESKTRSISICLLMLVSAMGPMASLVSADHDSAEDPLILEWEMDGNWEEVPGFVDPIMDGFMDAGTYEFRFTSMNLTTGDDYSLDWNVEVCEWAGDCEDHQESRQWNATSDSSSETWNLTVDIMDCDVQIEATLSNETSGDDWSYQWGFVGPCGNTGQITLDIDVDGDGTMESIPGFNADGNSWPTNIEEGEYDAEFQISNLSSGVDYMFSWMAFGEESNGMDDEESYEEGNASWTGVDPGNSLEFDIEILPSTCMLVVDAALMEENSTSGDMETISSFVTIFQGPCEDPITISIWGDFDGDGISEWFDLPDMPNEEPAGPYLDCFWSDSDERWWCGEDYDEDGELDETDDWWYYCEYHVDTDGDGDWFCTDDFGQSPDHEFSANQTAIFGGFLLDAGVYDVRFNITALNSSTDYGVEYFFGDVEGITQTEENMEFSTSSTNDTYTIYNELAILPSDCELIVGMRVYEDPMGSDEFLYGIGSIISGPCEEFESPFVLTYDGVEWEEEFEYMVFNESDCYYIGEGDLECEVGIDWDGDGEIDYYDYYYFNSDDCDFIEDDSDSANDAWSCIVGRSIPFIQEGNHSIELHIEDLEVNETYELSLDIEMYTQMGMTSHVIFDFHEFNATSENMSFSFNMETDNFTCNAEVLPSLHGMNIQVYDHFKFDGPCEQPPSPFTLTYDGMEWEPEVVTEQFEDCMDMDDGYYECEIGVDEDGDGEIDYYDYYHFNSDDCDFIEDDGVWHCVTEMMDPALDEGNHSMVLTVEGLEVGENYSVMIKADVCAYFDCDGEEHWIELNATAEEESFDFYVETDNFTCYVDIRVELMDQDMGSWNYIASEQFFFEGPCEQPPSPFTLTYDGMEWELEVETEQFEDCTDMDDGYYECEIDHGDGHYDYMHFEYEQCEWSEDDGVWYCAVYSPHHPFIEEGNHSMELHVEGLEIDESYKLMIHVNECNQVTGCTDHETLENYWNATSEEEDFVFYMETSNWTCGASVMADLGRADEDGNYYHHIFLESFWFDGPCEAPPSPFTLTYDGVEWEWDLDLEQFENCTQSDEYHDDDHDGHHDGHHDGQGWECEWGHDWDGDGEADYYEYWYFPQEDCEWSEDDSAWHCVVGRHAPHIEEGNHSMELEVEFLWENTTYEVTGLLEVCSQMDCHQEEVIYEEFNVTNEMTEVVDFHMETDNYTCDAHIMVSIHNPERGAGYDHRFSFRGPCEQPPSPFTLTYDGVEWEMVPHLYQFDDCTDMDGGYYECEEGIDWDGDGEADHYDYRSFNYDDCEWSEDDSTWWCATHYDQPHIEEGEHSMELHVEGLDVGTTYRVHLGGYQNMYQNSWNWDEGWDFNATSELEVLEFMLETSNQTCGVQLYADLYEVDEEYGWDRHVFSDYFGFTGPCEEPPSPFTLTYDGIEYEDEGYTLDFDYCSESMYGNHECWEEEWEDNGLIQNFEAGSCIQHDSGHWSCETDWDVRPSLDEGNHTGMLEIEDLEPGTNYSLSVMVQSWTMYGEYDYLNEEFHTWNATSDTQTLGPMYIEVSDDTCEVVVYMYLMVEIDEEDYTTIAYDNFQFEAPCQMNNGFVLTYDDGTGETDWDWEVQESWFDGCWNWYGPNDYMCMDFEGHPHWDVNDGTYENDDMGPEGECSEMANGDWMCTRMTPVRVDAAPFDMVWHIEDLEADGDYVFTWAMCQNSAMDLVGQDDINFGCEEYSENITGVAGTHTLSWGMEVHNSTCGVQIFADLMQVHYDDEHGDDWDRIDQGQYFFGGPCLIEMPTDISLQLTHEDGTMEVFQGVDINEFAVLEDSADDMDDGTEFLLVTQLIEDILPSGELSLTWDIDMSELNHSGTDEYFLGTGYGYTTETFYTCDDGQVIPFRFVNDDNYDCDDGSDEVDDPMDESSVFVCGDGEEIPFRWINDGEDDCDDESDEWDMFPEFEEYYTVEANDSAQVDWTWEVPEEACMMFFMATLESDDGLVGWYLLYAGGPMYGIDGNDNGMADCLESMLPQPDQPDLGDIIDEMTIEWQYDATLAQVDIENGTATAIVSGTRILDDEFRVKMDHDWFDGDGELNETEAAEFEMMFFGNPPPADCLPNDEESGIPDFSMNGAESWCITGMQSMDNLANGSSGPVTITQGWFMHYNVSVNDDSTLILAYPGDDPSDGDEQDSNATLCGSVDPTTGFGVSGWTYNGTDQTSDCIDVLEGEYVQEIVITFVYTVDSDGDGYNDLDDRFPSDPEEWMDSDEDGVGDNHDAFPADPTETFDLDGDGVGDNSDAFPWDPTESSDSDGDGVGDNADAFPDDPNETLDTDLDGVGDNADTDADGDGVDDDADDSDGDGVVDSEDAFPNDANESTDADGDGVGDNSDAFPDDANESTDTDGDGLGDNSDPDADGDGVENGLDDFPLNSGESSDADGDGVGDSEDAFPNDPNEYIDSDGDGVGDNADTDDDNDGTPDTSDVFPLDPSETSDTDGDGYGDVADAFPNDAGESSDYDGDGVGDNSDAFMSDPYESRDTDGDGVGDNADWAPNDPNEILDSDGDGVGNNADAFPTDASESKDTDDDGIGDNADDDADGDGIPDDGIDPVDDEESGGILPGFTAITGLASVLGAAILVAGRRKD